MTNTTPAALHLLGSFPIGTTLNVQVANDRFSPGRCEIVRRVVDGKGNPRTDIQILRVRVVAVKLDTRRLSADNIMDGARHTDRSVVEVCS